MAAGAGAPQRCRGCDRVVSGLYLMPHVRAWLARGDWDVVARDVARATSVCARCYRELVREEPTPDTSAATVLAAAACASAVPIPTLAPAESP